MEPMETGENDYPSTSVEKSGVSRETPTDALARGEFESLLSDESEDERETIRLSIDGTGHPLARTSFPGDKTETSEDLEDMILSLIWRRSHLGAAYYEIGSSELFVMEDIQEDSLNFGTMKALHRQCQPRYIVTVTGGPESFSNALKKLILTESPEQEPSSSGSCVRSNGTLTMLPKREHGYERCYHRVRCLRLECEPEQVSEEERTTYLASILSFKSHAMIHALGALLLFLDHHWNQIALDPSGGPSFVALKHVTMRDLVMVSENTYEALNIVDPSRDQPVLFKFGNRPETGGISLFTILNRCRSRDGERFLWETLQHPSRDLTVIDQRLRTIEFFMNPGNQSIAENLLSCLKHVYRVTHVLASRCSSLHTRASNWQKLHKTVSHIIYIADICGRLGSEIELFRKIAGSVTDEMQYMKYFIEYIVDFEGSKREKNFVVKPNVDPILDELNHVRNMLPDLLTQMGEKDMREHLPTSVNGCNMLYLPNIGYVLAIKEWNPTPPEDMIFPGLEFKFTINRVRYYKSPSAKELDNTVGDVMLKITKRQDQILRKLVRYVNKHASQVLDAVHLCAELDTLLSFYMAARDNNYVKPNVVPDRVIEIKEGRHPLQELLTTFVPNDVCSGDGHSRVKVLTGPNSCGKSIYLRQIGLIVFMAHVGSYVPAKSATIGVVTHILTQILSTESIVLNASSFLHDLRQVSTTVSASTANSLVIIDEFGRGTSEVSGVSLFAAVLSNFVERGEDSPHVFATTHLHQALRFLPQNSIVEAQTFEYIVNDDGSLSFLYRLTSGSSGQSFAHAVAKSAGLDKRIVERSLEVFRKLKEGTRPPPLPNNRRRIETEHIVQRLARSNGHVDLEQLMRLIREAVLVPRKGGF